MTQLNPPSCLVSFNKPGCSCVYFVSLLTVQEELVLRLCYYCLFYPEASFWVPEEVVESVLCDQEFHNNYYQTSSS